MAKTPHRKLSKEALKRRKELMFPRDQGFYEVDELKGMTTGAQEALLGKKQTSPVLPGAGHPTEGYLAVLHPDKQSPEGLLNEVRRVNPALQMADLEAAAAAKYGGTPQEAMASWVAEAGKNYTMTSPGIQSAKHAVDRALLGAGQELRSGKVSPELAELMGVDQDALAKVYGAESKPKSKGDGTGIPEWLPHMSNIPPMQTGLAYGALGTGAAALLTAQILSQQGAQQVDNQAYADMVRASNAY